MSMRKDDIRARSKNAYMLIYERVAYFHMPTIRKLSEELKTMQVIVLPRKIWLRTLRR